MINIKDEKTAKIQSPIETMCVGDAAVVVRDDTEPDNIGHLVICVSNNGEKRFIELSDESIISYSPDNRILQLDKVFVTLVDIDIIIKA